MDPFLPPNFESIEQYRDWLVHAREPRISKWTVVAMLNEIERLRKERGIERSEAE